MKIFLLLLLTCSSAMAQNALFDTEELIETINYIQKTWKIEKFELGNGSKDKLEKAIKDQNLDDENADFIRLIYQFATKPVSVTKTRAESLTSERLRTLRSTIQNKTSVLYPYKLQIADLPLPSVTGTASTSSSENLTGMSLESRLLYATSNIIAERFKEQATIEFFRNFNKALENELIKKLLPNTEEFLRNFQDNPNLSFPSLGQSWKTALEKDFQDSPQHLLDYLNSKSNKTELYYTLYVAEKSFNLLNQGVHPANIIRTLAENPENAKSSPFSNGISMLSLLSKNLKDATEDRKWLPPERLDTYSNPQKGYYFFWLLYTRNDDLFRNTLQTIPTDENDKIVQDFIKLTHQFLVAAEVIENTIKKQILSIRNGQQQSPDEISAYISSFSNIFQIAGKFFELNDRNSSLSQRWSKLVGTIYNIHSSASKKDYGYLLINLLSLMQDSNSGIDSTIVRKYMKYGIFLTDVITAKDDEQMQRAISAAILPPNSYLTKRNSNFTVSINAYAGLSGGVELLRNETTGKFGQRQLHGGLNAPLGVEFAWGKGCFGSFGIYTTLLDLGAIANFRFLNDNSKVSSVPVIDFRQVFSPGIRLQFGFNDSPISLGLGLALNPEIRKVTVDGIEKNRDGLKLFLSISTDIPLFHLYIGDDE